MEFGKRIFEIRNNAKLTQAQFAELFDVSQQAVQKWESGVSAPDIDKIIKIAKYFDVSLDALVMGNNNRIVEEMNRREALKPQYQRVHDWEFYSSDLMTEYQQSLEEGLDIEGYKELFSAVSLLPKGEIKKRFGDILFDIVINAEMREGYPYVEPSDLEQIQLIRRGSEERIPYDASKLKSKIHGAWLGRICGCMLGRSVEGVMTEDLVPFLKETGNYPMHRYIYRSDLKDIDLSKYKFNFAGRLYADEIDGMPFDDDTNYTVLAQLAVERYGRNFTPFAMSRIWLSYQGKDSYCTAERVAYCNFIKGYSPPQSAIYKNPYREWIGAQIRGDYFGYINPGNPKLAAEMAWRDASMSHVKNGIYGEMLVAAMLAIAATTEDVEAILLGGLAEIPQSSRLHEQVMWVYNAYKNGTTQKECFDMIHKKYDEHSDHEGCHTIANALIVVAALLYGEGDYGKSICMSVDVGFDTDCNAATVGSILGMAKGVESIPEYWTSPMKNKLDTTICGVGTVKITDCVEKTMQHVE